MPVWAGAETRVVRIGVYDNPPKVEVDMQGIPQGIFLDIIEKIAGNEGWELEYVRDTWNGSLESLEQGSIDLMPDVALSDRRRTRFDFNSIAVLNSWVQVYCRKGTAVSSISDLRGKRVAVLEGSIQEHLAADMLRNFNIPFALKPFPDYNTIAHEVASGRVDAVIVSRFYGYRRNKIASLKPTPLILSSTTLHFATGKGRNSGLLTAIDRNLSEMINNPHSAYYTSLNRWLNERPRMFIPSYILWSVSIIAVALFFFFALSVLLRKKVKERTVELEKLNSDLNIALKELKTARDEALKRERLHAFGQLASGLAHDFNNLLFPIMSYASMMLDRAESFDRRKESRENIEKILAAARHGTEIVSRMQQFYYSSREFGKAGYVDLTKVVNEVIDLCRPRLDREGKRGRPVEVILDLDKNCMIKGRESDIHEILMNLVLNAADAMPHGGRLTVSTETVNDFIIITVRDEGTGMPDHVKEKCLEPFFTTKGEEGTGMGLSMVNTIVAEHNGSLQIESVQGEGTRFIITFPIDE